MSTWTTAHPVTSSTNSATSEWPITTTSKDPVQTSCSHHGTHGIVSSDEKEMNVYSMKLNKIVV